MGNSVFDLSQISINLIVDGTPTDISSGLTIDSDFLKIAKETKEEVKSRKGTQGESYSVNSNQDDNRIIDLTYLPSATAVPILQKLKETKKVFGLFIKSDTSPKYTLTSSACMVIEEPETTVHGKDGFKDYTFKIRATDSKQIFGG